MHLDKRYLYVNFWYISIQFLICTEISAIKYRYQKDYHSIFRSQAEKIQASSYGTVLAIGSRIYECSYF